MIAEYPFLEHTSNVLRFFSESRKENNLTDTLVRLFEKINLTDIVSYQSLDSNCKVYIAILIFTSKTINFYCFTLTKIVVEILVLFIIQASTVN